MSGKPPSSGSQGKPSIAKKSSMKSVFGGSERKSAVTLPAEEPTTTTTTTTTRTTEKTPLVEASVKRRLSKKSQISLSMSEDDQHNTGYESLCVCEPQSSAKITKMFNAVKADFAAGKHHEHAHTPSRWMLNGTIGFVCGLSSFLLKEVIALLFRTRTKIIFSVIDGASGEGDQPWVGEAWVRAVVFAAVLLFISASIVIFFEPNAAGSGIPETCAFLNGVIIPKTFSLRVVFAKFASCALAVGSGIPAGPEGPM